MQNEERAEGNTRLIDLPLEHAIIVKFDRGVREHGPIMELDPIEELFSEMIDSINYCDAIAREFGSLSEIGRQALRIKANCEAFARSAQAMHGHRVMPYRPVPSVRPQEG